MKINIIFQNLLDYDQYLTTLCLYQVINAYY